MPNDSSQPVTHLSNRSAPEADLTACDREPIRVPGAIQPHGRMLVLDARTLRIAAFSANWEAGSTEQAAAFVRERQAQDLPVGAPAQSLGVVRLGALMFDASAHRTADHVIAEFEPAMPSEGNEAPIYSLMRVFLPKLQRAGSLDELSRIAVAEMKRLTGFGRCLLYRFDAEGHGEVLAQVLDPGYDSYAGHHFPASDIPRQARELYLLSRFRLIADANYRPVPLQTTDASLAAHEIDLSQSQLRSVSPVHLEYMRNMGTLASASVSIVVEGRLWGLISCHDHAPRPLSIPTRRACEHLGQLLALQIESNSANASVAERLELRKLTLEIVAQLAESDATLQRLAGEASLMLGVVRAAGAAVVLNGQVWQVGDTPEEAQILELSQWIAGMGVEVYHSDALGAHFAAAQAYTARGAGVLAISISQVHRHLILWFRPEIVQTVTWAGQPSKAATASSDGRIHPRLSFASWVEHIRGRSAPWSDAELGAAAELRQALIGIVLRRAEEMAAVATELGRVNKELEAFSYTVSHDLRAPMRHIAGYVDLVVSQEKLSDRSLRYLSHVREASTFAGQLVDSLLDFSRMGRASIKRRAVDTSMLVSDLVRELSRGENGPLEWVVDPELPRLHADALLLQVAVRNLLSNAIKYSRGRDPAHIVVRGVRTASGDGLEVEDNGVGFQMKYADKLFGVFQRLHAAEEFEGTGIGLANVKRIVERHGGEVWARAEVDRGATFGFLLPRAGDVVPDERGEEKNA
ncbi:MULTISPECIES: ATP-binding protein [unclassified Variovorax]|uniref:ATP-binding protein n=1 Tax=unclassified Variovorax TaxID=663243 RepID=UPI000837B458|nr:MULTISPECIES: ATP-binding protein [unclassified Variovorax]PNG52168.1 Phytochrome-like protein cph1 [Variovorax sp. B4]PNG54708.1 Phytochrome-like protein cph1 [Variovorax sp. B2]VTV15697.1 Phytochrome-like protein cph1 [Variovorax sp. WDL1]